MQIRQANEGDILKASRLWLEMVEETQPGSVPDLGVWCALTKKFMPQNGYKMLVAENDGRLLGFSDWFLFVEPSTGDTCAASRHLFVEKSHRSSGVSSTLYRNSLRQMKESGAVSCVLATDFAKVSFWRKKGFAPIEVAMRRSL